MFVLTVDQVGSRHAAADAVAPVVSHRAAWRDAGAVLGPDRTAGDEFQAVFEDAEAALRAALRLQRDGGWSVGIGVGDVHSPLPDTTREATGSAFVAARAAVESAKRSPHRLVVVASDAEAATGLTALIGLLLELRGRRSAEGWEVADLAEQGVTQAAMAERLGVSPQAISLRARAAGVRLERDALPALVRGLAALGTD